MTWSAPMPLTIASRDRSEYDKWAHIALSRMSPVIATKDWRIEQTVSAKMGMTPRRYAERRAKMLALLAEATLTRDEIWFRMRADFLLPQHVGRLLTQLKAEGLAELLSGNRWRARPPCP